MANTPVQHFAHYDGYTFALVVGILGEIGLPNQIANVPEMYRGPLTATLACELSSVASILLVSRLMDNFEVDQELEDILSTLGGEEYRVASFALVNAREQLRVTYAAFLESEKRGPYKFHLRFKAKVPTVVPVEVTTLWLRYELLLNRVRVAEDALKEIRSALIQRVDEARRREIELRHRSRAFSFDATHPVAHDGAIAYLERQSPRFWREFKQNSNAARPLIGRGPFEFFYGIRKSSLGQKRSEIAS